MNVRGPFNTDQWSDFIEAMHSDDRCEIDEEIYWYFLEVLPPVYMNKSVELVDGTKIVADFGFAEGYEVVTAFWRAGESYFCQKTKIMNPYA